MNTIDQLKAVLCDPEGKCCVAGSDEDRAIVDRALEALAQLEEEPVGFVVMERQPLTEDEIENLLISWPKDSIAFIDFARAIELHTA